MCVHALFGEREIMSCSLQGGGESSRFGIYSCCDPVQAASTVAKLLPVACPPVQRRPWLRRVPSRL